MRKFILILSLVLLSPAKPLCVFSSVATRHSPFQQSSALAAPSAAHAQLTIEECQQKAKAHYPEIARYDLIAESEQYTTRSAARSWIPQIGLSGQATWQSAVANFPEQLIQMLEMQGVSMPGLAKDQYKVALDIQQTLWDGGVSKANRKMAKAEANEQRVSSDVSMYSLNERINSLFFGILLLDEHYATALSRRELLESNLAKLESIRNHGAALQADLDLVKVELLSLGQQIDQNRASRQNFAIMLSLFIGESVEGKQLVKPEAPMVPSLENRRPELLLLDAKIAGLDARNDMINSNLTPKFSLFAQGFYGNPGLDMFKGMMSKEWTWNAYLGVRMQWNVSAFLTAGTDRRKLDNARRTFELQKEVFRFNTNLQTVWQNGEIVRMQKALESDDEIVALRENVRRTAESQREAGVIDTSALLQSISDEAVARNTRSIHEMEMLKAIYELKNSVNL